ncbi:MAG: hypothetical protein M3Q06_00910 [Bacteroidota bacterium]|nr:hypothetical protein [Bacteroidota bacterium]
MKQVSVLTIAALLSAFPFCSNAQNPSAKQVKNGSEEPLYTIEANNISIGNKAFSQVVLRAWKDYDNNTLDNSAGIFADDVMSTFPDGTVVKGKENLLKMTKEHRNSLAAVSSSINAVTTLKTPDDPEHEVVSIWGTETNTRKDGTTTKTHLNELWFFNKAGKVVRIHQMAAKDEADK